MDNQDSAAEPYDENATGMGDSGTVPPRVEEPKAEAPPEPKGARAKNILNSVGDYFASERFNPLAVVDRLDDVLAWARRIFPIEKFDGLAAALVKFGHLALIVAEISCVVLGLTAAIKMSDVRLFPAGVGVGLLLVILQYTASRFMDAGHRLLGSSPSRLGSAAFLDCLALLMEVIGLCLFFAYWVQGGWSGLFVGLAIWALCDAIAYISLHPAMVNIDVGGEVGAGEEAIGIMSFAVKTIVRLVPMAFGIGAILGTVALIIGTFGLMGSGNPAGALSALRLITLCVLLPFLSYILFAFYHLLIDLLRAILVLPRTLDK